MCADNFAPLDTAAFFAIRNLEVASEQSSRLRGAVVCVPVLL